MPNNSLASIYSSLLSNVSTAGDASLVEVANLAAEKVRSNAPTKDIAQNVKVSSLERDANSISILISIDGKEAPEAPAFEFGTDTYRIDPNKKQVLYFPWDTASPPDPDMGEGEGKLAFFDGNFGMHYVDHPGIEARPFFFESVLDAIKELHDSYNNKISIAWASSK